MRTSPAVLYRGIVALQVAHTCCFFAFDDDDNFLFLLCSNGLKRECMTVQVTQEGQLVQW